MTSIGRIVSLRGDSPPAPVAPQEEPALAQVPLLIICRGLPASGKTTWAKNWVADHPYSRSRVNRDDLRQSLFGLDAGTLTHDQEKTVTYMQHSTIRALLRNGRSVVCDDTNLRARTVRELLGVAQQAGVCVEFQDFPTPAALCVQRDLKRALEGERSVGSAVIQSFAERYIKKGELPTPPTLEDGAEAGAALQYTPDTSLPSAWLVDMDGTLAKMNGRGPFEWHRVGEDEPNDPVIEVVEALAGDCHDIVVVSGRDESCRAETEQWLGENDIYYAALFMRPAGDQRKDALVKTEIFWRDIAPRWEVRGVLDDRDQVVRMWRNLGLTCLQVAPGNF